jgi:3-oxoadipate enol-lactonase
MRLLPPFAAKILGKPGLPWVTFVPGIGNDSGFWANQAERLTDKFRVLTFDPWGHGDSPSPPEGCRLSDVMDGLIQLLDTYAIERTALVGLGFGGSVALATALDHKERVSRVVACCCRPRQPDNRRAFWRDRRAKAAEIGMARITDMTVDRWLGEDFRVARPDVDRALRAMMNRTTLAGYQAYVGAFVEMDFGARLGEMAVPTLLIAGENDHGGGPPDDMRKVANAIPGARFELIEGAGHIVNFEAPECLAELIGKFVAADLAKVP